MQLFLRLIISVTFVLCLTAITSSFDSTAFAEDSSVGKQRVARGLFTTNIVDREPVDQVLMLSNAVKQIYFFTDLRHYQGQTITHRWEHEGKLVMEKTFEVSGPRWRVYSEQDLEPDMTGTWTVVVSDGKNWPIYAALFQYVEKVPGGEKGIILPLEE